MSSKCTAEGSRKSGFSGSWQVPVWVLHGSATSMPFALFEETIARNIIDQGLFKALYYTTFVGYWRKLLLGSVMSFQLNLEDSFSHLTLVRVPFTGRVPVQMVDLNISDIQWMTTSLLCKKQGSYPETH